MIFGISTHTLALPAPEIVPQETIDRLLGITALRESHEMLRAALRAIAADRDLPEWVTELTDKALYSIPTD